MGNRFLMIRSRNQGRSIEHLSYGKLTHDEFVRELDRCLTNAGIHAEGPLQIRHSSSLLILFDTDHREEHGSPRRT